jgi:hypothetical protein
MIKLSQGADILSRQQATASHHKMRLSLLNYDAADSIATTLLNSITGASTPNYSPNKIVARRSNAV